MRDLMENGCVKCSSMAHTEMVVATNWFSVTSQRPPPSALLRPAECRFGVDAAEAELRSSGTAGTGPAPPEGFPLGSV